MRFSETSVSVRKTLVTREIKSQSIVMLRLTKEKLGKHSKCESAVTYRLPSACQPVCPCVSLCLKPCLLWQADVVLTAQLRILTQTRHKQFNTETVYIHLLVVLMKYPRVTERLMSIVSAACFYIASKLLEAEESAPTAHEIAGLNSWTAKDLCRMELHVLGRLGWRVSFVSYLTLLPVLADVFGLNRKLVVSDSVVGLAGRFLCRQSTIMVMPSTLAFALVQHIMGEGMNNPAEIQVRVHCNIEDAQLVECNKLLSFLSDTDYTSSPVSPPRLAPKFPLKIFDKPSMAGVTPLYTIVEEPAAA
ncbi:hypothetical protein RRG08_039656 [Elysia crispata]|uniref:Cyclin N-terminal domain-containing protein n=1 Tax=Elysia crispata TaxID=231223 RepID=A0AAE0YAZ9_9GAST|nr:hypothetical protein RRG08_039656 [Elysia crispata]